MIYYCYRVGHGWEGWKTFLGGRLQGTDATGWVRFLLLPGGLGGFNATGWAMQAEEGKYLSRGYNSEHYCYRVGNSDAFGKILYTILTPLPKPFGSNPEWKLTKHCSTRGSQEIPHPSTNRAQPRLTSEF